MAIDHAIDAVRLERLMAELDWIRRLARALTHDAAAADDAAQDAWLLAAQHPPDDARPLRPWLRRLVLNAVRMRLRGDGRRAARESRAAPETRDAVSPAELIERVELQRAVADEVLALSEPYRSTVLLCFVEGLSSAQIAKQLGVPDGTVRRRLKVALDQLRDRLAQRDGAPKAGWLAALVPFAQLSGPWPVAAASVGVLAMKKIVVAVLVVMLLFGALMWSWLHAPSIDDERPALAAAAAAPRPRSAVAAPSTIPAWTVQPGVAGRRIAGVVTAADGPVRDAIVRLAVVTWPEVVLPVTEQRTDAAGTFDFGVQPATAFAVSAEAPKRTPASLMIDVASPRTAPDQLVLRLGNCTSRLYGTVRDASGGAIRHARLTTAHLGGTESDAAGGFSLCLPDHNSRVVVEAEGYGAAVVLLHLFGDMRRDVVLVPEAILVGQVVSESGAPVAGAQVRAMPNEAENRRRSALRWATTDGDGRFQILGLSPGKFLMTAMTDTAATSAPQIEIARPTATAGEVRVIVEALTRIRGRIVMDGRPVSGVSIVAMRSDSPARGRSGVSQPDGSFALSGAFRGATVFVARPYEVVKPTSLAVTGAAMDDVVIEVRPMGTLRGRVTKGGVPVEGAVVTSVRRQIQARTDASGAFVLEGLVAGLHLIHTVALEARAAAEDMSVAIAAGGAQTLDIELVHTGRVTGTVVDENGAPVANAYIHMDPVGRPLGSRGGESMTNAAGAFDCGGVPSGDYAITVHASPAPMPPFERIDPGARTQVHVDAGATVSGLRLAIRHERVAIRGQVVDGNGGELADVYVEAIGGHDYGTMAIASAITNTSGGFEISDLSRGNYTVRARAADGSEIELRDVASGADPMTITLRNPGAIEGTLSGFSAAPLVEIHSDTANQYARSRVTVSGNTFSAHGLAAGRYVVRAKAGVEIDGQAVEVRSGETARVALHGRGLGEIEGTLIEHGSGAPIAGARCDATLSIGGKPVRANPDPALQTTTDATGRFAMQVPIGATRVMCAAPDGATSIAGIDVEVVATERASVGLVAVRRARASDFGDAGLQLVIGALPITVESVVPSGPAATAGIVAGDRVVSIDGAAMRGFLPMGASLLLANRRPGTTATIGIERNGAAQTVELVLGAARR